MARKEWELLFNLSAKQNSSFSSTFKAAQSALVETQGKIQQLNKVQSDISAYQKQQQAVDATRQRLSVLQQQYDNIQKEIQETEGYSSALENKLLSKQAQIDKTTASLNTYEQRLAATGFLSTPSARRATATATSLGYSVEISIHALREEGDPGAVQGRDLRPDISIHALREEGDLRMLLNSALISLFLSTPSARRATSSCQTDFCGSTDFYPRPPRGGRPTTRRRWGARNGNFYPRPPRGGRPSSGILPTPLDSHFYPRPPRGGRPRRLCRPRRKREFLSTPSARRATCSGQACASHRKYFYPRPPRGGRP